LSPQTNLRTDDFGGSSKKRAEIVLRIIQGIRKATSNEFCIGIKMNSVDAASAESLSDVMEQIKLIVECGIDFIEISGGSYENPRMMAEPQLATNSTPTDSSNDSNLKTSQRESFFLEFAKAVRENFPSVVLMVTGGFRTRVGMEGALQSGNCDLIGIGRPAAVVPKLPKEIILNTQQIADEKAQVALAPVPVPFIIKHIPVKQVGAGVQSQYYGSQIQRMGQGLGPIDTRIQVTE